MQGKGDVGFWTASGHDRRQMARNVLHAPGMVDNLISVLTLTGNALEVPFSRDDCRVYSWKHLVTSIRKRGSVYNLHADVLLPSEDTHSVVRQQQSLLWHHHTGHINFDVLHNMSTRQLVNGIPHLQRSPLDGCVSCVQGKLSREPFKISGDRSR